MRQIDIQINRPGKPEKPQPAKPDITWPTWDPDDEDEPTLIMLTFYDGASKKSGENWIDIAEWSNHDNTSLLWEHEQTFDEGKPFFVAPHRCTYQVHGNQDSRVRAEIIANEFADSNDKRWERKPLATRPAEWRYTGNRWLTGGTYIIVDPVTGGDVIKSDYSQFNIHTELVSSSEGEPQGRIDPDAYHDGEAKRLKLKWIRDEGTVRPLIYYGHFPGRKLGLRVKDQSKSFAQYVSPALATGFDWIDSIYFCPFDTTNDTEFKVTSQPSFDADEVSGKMLGPGNKFDVFLIPRRWLFRVRYRHQENVYDASNDTVLASPSSKCENHLNFYFHDIENEAIKCDYNSATNTMTAWYANVTHYDCFFWGRWPCNWSALWSHEAGHQVEESSVDVMFWDGTGAQVSTVTLVSSETSDEAKANYLSAGAGVDITDYMFTGGLSSNLHICSDTSGFYVKVGDSSYGFSPLCAVAHTAWGGPVYTRSEEGYSYIGATPSPDSPEFGLKRLWQVIEESTVWTDVIEPWRNSARDGDEDSAQASRIDMIPWGVAVSPSMTGDLVGIIRNRGRAWFVWRKTDEEITPWVSGSISNPIRWESNNEDGRLGGYWEGDYAGENVYDGDLPDIWAGDATRKLTGFGRTISIEEADADDYCTELVRQFAIAEGEPEVSLHAPAFVMLSDERAFSDVNWSTVGEGTNVGLRGRVGRVNAFTSLSADTRNAY